MSRELPTRLDKLIIFYTTTCVNALSTSNAVVIRKSMVHPIVEFAAPVWDPYTLSNIHKLESIQRMAARFCYSDFSRFSSVTDMLSSLNLPSLQNKAKLLAFYKMINEHLMVPMDDLTPKLSSPRNGYYHQLLSLIDAYKYSFFPSTIKLWNQLPTYICTYVYRLSTQYNSALLLRN